MTNSYTDMYIACIMKEIRRIQQFCGRIAGIVSRRVAGCRKGEICQFPGRKSSLLIK